VVGSSTSIEICRRFPGLELQQRAPGFLEVILELLERLALVAGNDRFQNRNVLPQAEPLEISIEPLVEELNLDWE
jgi:hypothetical protein